MPQTTPTPRQRPCHGDDAEAPFGRAQVGALGRRVRALRLARHWSLSRLAREAGLSVAAVRSIERGDADPRLLSVLSLAEALGEPIDRLVEAAREAGATVQVTRAAGAADGRAVGDLTRGLHEARMQGQVVTLPPGGGAAMTTAAGQPVFCHVLAGALSVRFADGHTEHLEQGDSLHSIEERPARLVAAHREPAVILRLTDTKAGDAGARPAAERSEA